MLDYIIIPNHIHYIVFLAGDHAGSPLPQIVDWYKTMTTNKYIRGVKNGLFVPFDQHLRRRGYHDHSEIVGATLCGRLNNPDKIMEKWLIEAQNRFVRVKIDKLIIYTAILFSKYTKGAANGQNRLRHFILLCLGLEKVNISKRAIDIFRAGDRKSTRLNSSHT